MKSCLSCAVLLLGVVILSGCKSLPDAPPATLLQNLRIFDTETGEMIGPFDLLIQGERIQALNPPGASIESARSIDCTGKFAVPGLFDCHTHLAHLCLEGEDAARAGLLAFVRRGITHVRDVGGPVDLLQNMSKETAGPKIFYTGPMLEGSPLTYESLNDALPGFTVTVDSVEDVERILPDLARKGAFLIKTFNRIDDSVYQALVKKARALSLKIVHDPGGPLFHAIPMDRAIDLGVTSIEHAKAPWPVVLRDDLKKEHDLLLGPGVDPPARMAFMMKTAMLGEASVSLERLARLADRMVENNVFFCPTLNVLDAMEAMAYEQVKKEQNLDRIPEEMKKMIGKGVAAMAAVSRLFVAELSRRGVKLLVGQDGCDPAGTFREMGRLEDCGVPCAEIIKGSTIYPARWLSLDHDLGSIAPGKEADILVVDADPLEKIENLEKTFLVVHKGEVIVEETPMPLTSPSAGFGAGEP